MVVKIEEIQEGGLALRHDFPTALVEQALTQGPSTGFAAMAGLHLEAKLTKLSGRVLFLGKFTTEVRSTCKRCLAEVTVPLPVDFSLNLVPKHLLELPQVDDEGEDDEGSVEAGSFGLDAVNDEPFDGKKIDLDPILREQVLLALPMNVVCREDCQGLCGQCGQNLNEKRCGCREASIDLRLLPLKNIKLS